MKARVKDRNSGSIIRSWNRLGIYPLIERWERIRSNVSMRATPRLVLTPDEREVAEVEGWILGVV
jgi:hypothetical protein